MIPNIVHFIYDDESKDKEFLFVYYISILSCKVINNPEKIYIYYREQPKGYWWERTKEIAEYINYEKSNESIIFRLIKLKEFGGVCLDINTVCVSKYTKLLENKCVISYENIKLDKNPIIMAEPNNSQINEWIKSLECSLLTEVTILKQSTFLLPNISIIFEDKTDIPEELLILSYGNNCEYYLKQITNFDWIINNFQTLYSKILLNILNNIDKKEGVSEGVSEGVTEEVLLKSINDENVQFLIMFGTMEGQYRITINRINDFYKKITNKKNFDIENFDDFLCAYKKCNSIGMCTILVQIITNCYFLYDTEEQILKHRACYQKMITFMTKNAGSLYKNINILNTFIIRNNAYAYSYHDLSNVEIFKNISTLQYKLCPDLLYNSLSTKKNNNTKIKVGFISDLLVTFHSVSKDRLGIIKHLCDDPEFDVKIMTRKRDICPFYTTIMDNHTSETIIYLDENDLSKNRRQIADQNFDIIVYPEIGMCIKTKWLAFSRLAPVQINTWGHSDTSGIPNIDYFVSSKFFNSKKDQSHYSEKLVLFDSLGTYYYDIFSLFPNEIGFEKFKMSLIKNKLREKVVKATGIGSPIIYGCIQIFIKIHPSFIQILNNILEQDKNAVIVLLSSEKEKKENVIFTKYINEKIKEINRVYFIHHAPFLEYAENIKNSDILLDYFPFGGFNSTIETFLLGKVCITRPGKRISGKFTEGLYKKMGITEFICNSEEEYVTKAIKYANDDVERKKYERLILDNNYKIIQEKKSVDEWKSLLKKLKIKK